MHYTKRFPWAIRGQKRKKIIFLAAKNGVYTPGGYTPGGYTPGITVFSTKTLEDLTLSISCGMTHSGLLKGRGGGPAFQVTCP